MLRHSSSQDSTLAELRKHWQEEMRLSQVNNQEWGKNKEEDGEDELDGYDAEKYGNQSDEEPEGEPENDEEEEDVEEDEEEEEQEEEQEEAYVVSRKGETLPVMILRISLSCSRSVDLPVPPLPHPTSTSIAEEFCDKYQVFDHKKKKKLIEMIQKCREEAFNQLSSIEDQDEVADEDEDEDHISPIKNIHPNKRRSFSSADTRPTLYNPSSLSPPPPSLHARSNSTSPRPRYDSIVSPYFHPPPLPPAPKHVKATSTSIQAGARLYVQANISKNKRETNRQVELESRRKEEEVKDRLECTFSPLLSPHAQSLQRNGPNWQKISDPYGFIHAKKLAKLTAKVTTMKEKDCTFHPNVSQISSMLVAANQHRNPVELGERLYGEAEELERKRKKKNEEIMDNIKNNASRQVHRDPRLSSSETINSFIERTSHWQSAKERKTAAMIQAENNQGEWTVDQTTGAMVFMPLFKPKITKKGSKARSSVYTAESTNNQGIIINSPINPTVAQQKKQRRIEQIFLLSCKDNTVDKESISKIMNRVQRESVISKGAKNHIDLLSHEEISILNMIIRTCENEVKRVKEEEIINQQNPDNDTDGRNALIDERSVEWQLTKEDFVIWWEKMEERQIRRRQN